MDIDYHALLPELILSGTILLVLIVDVFLSERRKWLAMPLGLMGVLATLAATLTLIGGDTRVMFDGTYVVDNFALLFKVFFMAVAVVVLALSLRYFREGGFYQGEYYFLLLTSFLGCVMMPSSRDMLLLFIALELVSAPGFLMAAFRKGDIKSNEAGVKFFIIGVLSTAVMLFGMSLIYGVTGGATQLNEIAAQLARVPGDQEQLALAAILFVVVGFAFKVSAVPFQFWAPDTYEGAPVPVAAFLAVASAAAGFAGLLQLMFVAFIGQNEFWVPLFVFLSVATMFVGNLVALQQTQVVRLLAYSGIAQAGYILLTFALVTDNPVTNQSAFSSAVAYILIYGIMNLGCVRRGRGGEPAPSHAPAQRFRRAREDGSLVGGGHDGVHDLAGRRAAHRWLLGQAADLPSRDRPGGFAGADPGRHHAGQLGHQHRVLLRGAQADDLQGPRGRLAAAGARAGHRGRRGGDGGAWWSSSSCRAPSPTSRIWRPWSG